MSNVSRFPGADSSAIRALSARVRSLESAFRRTTGWGDANSLTRVLAGELDDGTFDVILFDTDGATVLAKLSEISGGTYTGIVPWTSVSGKPLTFPPALPIAEADVTGLVADLAAKATAAAMATDVANLATHAALTTAAHGGIVASTDARLTDARTPTAHKDSHKSGGSDAFLIADLLDAVARAQVYINGTLRGTRRGINIIPSTGISLGYADDPTNEKIDVTITATGGVAPAAHASTHYFPAGSDALDPKNLDGATPWLIDIEPAMTAVDNTNWDTPTLDTAAIGNGTKDSSGAQNDEINFDVTLAAGTWTLEVMHRTDVDRGIYSVQLDTVEKGTIDGYGVNPAPTVRSSSSYQNPYGTWSATVPKPTGTASGDLLVMAVALMYESDLGAGTSASWNTPTGWTARRSVNGSAAGGLAYAIFTRVADGSEGSTFGVTLSGGYGTVEAVCYAIQGAASVSPIEDDQINTASIVIPSVTTTQANDLQLGFVIYGTHAHSAGNTINTTTPPAGFTEDQDHSGKVSFYEICSLEAVSITRAAIGATGTATPVVASGTTPTLFAVVSLAIKANAPTQIPARNVRSSVTGVAVATTGKKRLKLKMATKNAASSGYKGSLQHIQLRRTA